MRHHLGGIVVALACLGCCIGPCAGVLILDYFISPFGSEPFDQAKWAAADVEGRRAMAYDAIRHLPPGMLESEVVQLLGKREPRPTREVTRAAPATAVRTYCYWLGCTSLYTAWDDSYLWVHIDENGCNRRSYKPFS
jgi:cytosine/uracil/thiamine/allantoin permease